ncbi:hypothetical protein BDDG_09801 [Blastomyces dermatitidis ATCC 18188]|uniref:Uncharacterized protein n=1 Tax=Ajellomyces dermatitidis (strain ATCC 18188 / CBS 674.68) TaxID=653446 RepID=F2TUD8_AJEDA|nr:hypothetical protein BDDG_09801 [Blastomyces dermatitidis ATCC 18188]
MSESRRATRRGEQKMKKKKKKKKKMERKKKQKGMTQVGEVETDKTKMGNAAIMLSSKQELGPGSGTSRPTLDGMRIQVTFSARDFQHSALLTTHPQPNSEVPRTSTSPRFLY